MTRGWRWAAGILLTLVILGGLSRLRLATEILGLLPDDAPGVRALKLWDRHFSTAHQLTLTLASREPEATALLAQALAEGLRARPTIVGRVHWQPVWREDPDHGAAFVAWQWLNQSPAALRSLEERLAPGQLDAVLAETRSALQFSLSPDELARRAYDPFGFTELPGAESRLAAEFRRGDAFHASADGTFRVLTVRPAAPLRGFGEAGRWVAAVREAVAEIRAALPVGGAEAVTVRFTGGPAIAAETARDMERDMIGSVAGTAFLVAVLFGLAHRRLVPLLWLQFLLVVVVVATVGLGGWILGGLNVVSLGFAAILLGLVVDYALVLQQEMDTAPGSSLARIRDEQVRPIATSAVTTVGAFSLLNLSGIPGLAQLGTLVAVGTAVGAVVVLGGYLQPFLRSRSRKSTEPTCEATAGAASAAGAADAGAALPASPPGVRGIVGLTAGLGLLVVVAVGWSPPRFDGSPASLRPVQSESYAALDELQARLGANPQEVWVVFQGLTSAELATRLVAARPALEGLQRAGTLEAFEVPDGLWPRAEHWRTNRAVAQRLAARRAELLAALDSAGFQDTAGALAGRVLAEWQRLAPVAEPPPPSGLTGEWVWEQVAALDAEGAFALGTVRLAEGVSPAAGVREVQGALGPGAVAGSWEALGPGLRELAGRRIGWLLLAMLLVVGAALGLTFRDTRAVLLSFGVLAFAAALLLGCMAVAGWSWNLMNLLALPLLLGAGVDYVLHQQLALIRHRGDLGRVRRSTGRALWLCGGTTVIGFGSLAWSSNSGLAGLGRVCGTGIACVLLTAQFLLPVWWLRCGRPGLRTGRPGAAPGPSRLYGPRLWAVAVALTRWLPAGLLHALASTLAGVYRGLDPRRRAIVEANLRPVVGPVRAPAAARALFKAFAGKLVDLWRFEAGVLPASVFGELRGRQHLEAALATGRGVLLVTVHLGNWELGASVLAGFGRRLLVVTQAEPGDRFTARRREARAAQGIETLVVGENPLAFVEVIRRLTEGGLVALLADRPGPSTAATTTFLGCPFQVSRAPAELARAAGCVVLPVYIVQVPGGYLADVLPCLDYDRRTLGAGAERIRFAGEILRAFEPAVRQHPEQWFHFIPVWPPDAGAAWPGGSS